MNKNKVKKGPRRWLKRFLIVAGVFLLLIAGSVVGVYVYLKSIPLADIIARHNGNEADWTDEGGSVSTLIEKPVEKASELLGGQTISGQDAIDVAAILLNSGLSLKEIRYLQGNATYELSTKEKQSIRDLLLVKLTAEELEMLRQITMKYGKELLIADPDYPIEAVGEQDPEKRRQIEAKWYEQQKQEAEARAVSSNSGEDNKDSESDTNGNNIRENTAGMSAEAPSTVMTDRQKQVKAAIDGETERQLSALQVRCKASSNSMISRIIADLDTSDGGNLQKLQSNYLAEVAEAEASCDGQFESIMNEAEQSYEEADIASQAMPDWSGRYESVKRETRSAALASIANAINS